MKARTGTIVVLAIVMGALVLAAGETVRLRDSPDHGRFGAPFDVDPHSSVAKAIESASERLDAPDRSLLRQISRQPTSVWIAGGAVSARTKVADAVAGATRRGAIATLVAYNIPDRDCGGHSASSEAVEAEGYRAWVDAFTAGLAGAKAIVIVEPDALAQLDCLDRQSQRSRLELLRYAVRSFASTGSWVYLDAGHSGWKSSSQMARLLTEAGVKSATGFSLNVSNFRSTNAQISYGESIAAKLPSPAHFVIDTSRNGTAVKAGVWCNPGGAGLGVNPTVQTADELVDAYLWIKTPGASDGACNGGPAAGQWWNDYAIGLVKNRVVIAP